MNFILKGTQMPSMPVNNVTPNVFSMLSMPQIMVYSFCLSWLIPAFCFRNQVKTLQNHTYPYILGNLQLLFHSKLLRTYDIMNGILARSCRPNSCATLGSQWTSKPLSSFRIGHVIAVGDAVVGWMFCGIFQNSRAFGMLGVHFQHTDGAWKVWNGLRQTLNEITGTWKGLEWFKRLKV